MQRVVFFCFLLTVIGSGLAFGASAPSSTTNLDDVQLDESRLRVHFIDVGAGLGILIESPGDRKHLFVDGGDQGFRKMKRYVRKFVGNNTIDAHILTHADHDHFRNFSLLYDDYDIDEFWYTGFTSDELDGLARWPVFFETVKQDGSIQFYSPIKDYVSAGFHELVDDGGTANDPSDDLIIQYLNVDQFPPERDPKSGRAFDESQRRNNASLVFKLIYGDVSFLITGDINGRDKLHFGSSHDDEMDSEEYQLVYHHDRDVDRNLVATVLQLPHHGSNGSSSLKFLNAVSPEWVVISAGHKHDHPKEDTLRRIEKAGINKVLRTDFGDSTPEGMFRRDRAGDDSYIFETDGVTINKILRVSSP